MTDYPVRDVFCFHRPVDQMHGDFGHYDKLLRVWNTSWVDHQWCPRLVDPFECAKKHPLYQPFFNRCFSLPTCNPKDYEMSCWLRWPALAVVAKELSRPVLLVDSDVLNYGLLPLASPTQDITLLDGNCNACAVLVTPAGAERLVEQMFAWNPKHEQASDMWFFSDFATANPGLQSKPPICGEYRAHYPWQGLPLIHFATGACGGRGVAKERAISGYTDAFSGAKYQIS